jgi:ribonuclease T1
VPSVRPARRDGLLGVLAVLGVVIVVVAAFVLSGAIGGSSGGQPAATTATSGQGTCALSGLPAQVEDTVQEIRRGGPFPYRQDGVTFDNREHRLPGEPLGYYREYTVTTPGSSDRGTRRVIAGGGSTSGSARAPGALYYTGNHYASFCLLTGVR